MVQSWCGSEYHPHEAERVGKRSTLMVTRPADLVSWPGSFSLFAGVNTDYAYCGNNGPDMGTNVSVADIVLYSYSYSSSNASVGSYNSVIGQR